MSLKAVVFDYGMVLSGPADPQAHREMVTIFAAPTEEFEREYWAHRHAYDAGEFHGRRYWLLCAEGAGVTLSDTQIARLIAEDIRMWSVHNPVMVDWAIAISRSGLKTGILSNIPTDISAVFKHQSWVQNFTHNTWSGEIRLAKPDPAIYHHVLDKLQVNPEEALFLDDRQENVLSAEAVGLHGIIFRNPQQLQKELQDRGLAEFLPSLRVNEAVPATVL
jgi:putative hydrolase of the HAD superfamily